MNAADLRASILQVAIEGKLVPQLESEPEVEQIGEAPEDVPFKIPKKWKWLRLVFLVEKARQKVPDKTFHYVDVSSVNSGKGSISKMAVVEAKRAPSRARKIVEEGMVLFSTVRPYLKNVCLALKIPQETIASTAFATFSCSAYLNNRFALYVLTSPYFMNYVSQVQRGVAYPAISDKDFYSAFIPVPPLAEQHRIVARVNELLPLVDDFGEAQEAFEVAQTEFPGKLKDSLLQVAIEGKLVPQLESEPEVEQISETPEDVPFTIPLKWKWATIGDSLQYGSSEQVNGQSIPRNAWVLDLEDIEKESGRLLIKKRNISNRSNKAKFKKGDVLYGKLRPYLNKCIIADEAGFSTTEIVAIRPKEGNYKFDAEYLKAFLMSPFFVNYANQASYGVKMPRLGTKDAKAAFIPVPPLAEQCRIVARLNKLLASINQLGD